MKIILSVIAISLGLCFSAHAATTPRTQDLARHHGHYYGRRHYYGGRHYWHGRWYGPGYYGPSFFVGAPYYWNYWGDPGISVVASGPVIYPPYPYYPPGGYWVHGHYWYHGHHWHR